MNINNNETYAFLTEAERADVDLHSQNHDRVSVQYAMYCIFIAIIALLPTGYMPQGFRTVYVVLALIGIAWYVCWARNVHHAIQKALWSRIHAILKYRDEKLVKKDILHDGTIPRDGLSEDFLHRAVLVFDPANPTYRRIEVTVQGELIYCDWNSHPDSIFKSFRIKQKDFSSKEWRPMGPGMYGHYCGIFQKIFGYIDNPPSAAAA